MKTQLKYLTAGAGSDTGFIYGWGFRSAISHRKPLILNLYNLIHGFYEA
ncbi:MAG TPA: hypothetical protein PKA90_09365 [Ignavibacteria bacterium]|nr:hypothetical protein [Ignavibacteria bacterium]HMR40624.1 hypothetical protein [Ignavibacteria bacterium]